MDKRLIRVWALMRSGHHAIVEWILSGLDDPKIFFNNCRDKYTFHYVDFGRGEHIKKFDFTDINKFSNVIINFEHISPHFDNDWGNLRKHCDVTDVFVLRDPFNWVASSMSKKTFKQPVRVDVGLWKQYALKFLNPGNDICINFNEWFSKLEYREELANKLNIFNDENRVNKLATRSSFNARDFNENAQDMKVLERWKVFKNDQIFLNYVNKEDILKLSRQIFDFDPFEVSK